MLYNLQSARDNVRNREGKRVFYLGQGDQLTASARSFLQRQGIEILPAQLAKPRVYVLPGGAELTQKPEHMTHLHGNVLVPKTHPRIAFRGAMDTLEAELLLAQLVSDGTMRDQLQQVLDLARDLIRWEVLEEPVEERNLCGLDQQALRAHSHRPQDFYGQPHFMPQVTDGEVILRLNRARCAARQAELLAVAAFCDRDAVPTRPDLLQVMNRMSSMLYILMIRQKARQEGKGEKNGTGKFDKSGAGTDLC